MGSGPSITKTVDMSGLNSATVVSTALHQTERAPALTAGLWFETYVISPGLVLHNDVQ